MGWRNLEKLIMAFGNNPVALEGSESKQGEVKRVSFLNATGLQTLVQNCGRALKKNLYILLESIVHAVRVKLGAVGGRSSPPLGHPFLRQTWPNRPLKE